MAANDDSIPQKYPYAWKKDSEVSLTDFLAKYKPSLVQNDGTKPWIWVQTSDLQKTDQDEEAATKEAIKLLNEVTEEVERIKNDDSIPTRSSKKTGAKGKKELREQVQAAAAEKLKEISIKYKDLCGKWLIFSPTDRVDKVWSSLATSLVSGPLSETPAFCAKVATCPLSEAPHYQHVICLYMPNVYDKEAVTEVMKVLLNKHGFTLSGVKTDLYTKIGIDSKHPSGIPSTIWKPTSLLEASKIKELKDAYFASPGEATPAPKPPAPAEDAKPNKVSKPQLKKKAAEDDPFASDGEEGEAKAAPSKAKGKAKRAGDAGEETSRPRKKPAKA